MNPSDEQKIPPADELKAAAGPQSTVLPSPEPPKKKAGHGVRNALFLILLMIALGEAAYILREQLKSLGKPASNAGAVTSERKILYWQDPMHPQYTSTIVRPSGETVDSAS